MQKPADKVVNSRPARAPTRAVPSPAAVVTERTAVRSARRLAVFRSRVDAAPAVDHAREAAEMEAKRQLLRERSLAKSRRLMQPPLHAAVAQSGAQPAAADGMALARRPQPAAPYVRFAAWAAEHGSRRQRERAGCPVSDESSEDEAEAAPAELSEAGRRREDALTASQAALFLPMIPAPAYAALLGTSSAGLVGLQADEVVSWVRHCSGPSRRHCWRRWRTRPGGWPKADTSTYRR